MVRNTTSKGEFSDGERSIGKNDDSVVVDRGETWDVNLHRDIPSDAVKRTIGESIKEVEILMPKAICILLEQSDPEARAEVIRVISNPCANRQWIQTALQQLVKKPHVLDGICQFMQIMRQTLNEVDVIDDSTESATRG